MTTDLLSRLWLLASLYPGLVLVMAIILCLLGTLVALCLVSMTKPELPMHRWADDDEQAKAVTRPAPLGKHTRHGYQPANKVIPWGRRVQDPPRQP